MQKRGEKYSAFKNIFEAYYLPLRSFAYYFVGNDDITDDFVQDAFMKLWEKMGDFPDRASAKSFLYTVTKNSCLDHLKGRSVAGRNEKAVAASLWGPEDDMRVVEEEVHARIYNTIKELPPQARTMVLYTMEGLSNPQIAKMMEVSVNTVKTVKLRAYRVLREKLSGLSWVLFILWH